jgi:hypothetical protein
MGREIKRVPLDFDWPVGEIWPGNLLSICGIFSDMDDGCEKCRHFSRLANLEMTDYDCPTILALDVPKGDGWQIWETVSEGSAITPVFATPEELAKWCVENNNGRYNLAGPGAKPDYDGWLRFIAAGWAPSFVMTGGKLMSGVEAAGELSN